MNVIRFSDDQDSDNQDFREGDFNGYKNSTFTVIIQFF
jgi:hypothetical protein